jgi:hypothetical protein
LQAAHLERRERSFRNAEKLEAYALLVKLEGVESAVEKDEEESGQGSGIEWTTNML